MQQLTAELYEFTETRLTAPPRGEGWFFVQALPFSSTYGGEQISPHPGNPRGITPIRTSIEVHAVWARAKGVGV